jgi:hypothetical protein
MSDLSKKEVKEAYCSKWGAYFGYDPEKIFVDNLLNIGEGSAVFSLRYGEVKHPTPFHARRRELDIEIEPVPSWLAPYIF